MAKSEKNSVAATMEGFAGGTGDAAKSVAAIIKESSGCKKEAPKTGAAPKEGSFGGTKSKSVAPNMKESLGGNKNPKKSTVKPLKTMPTNVTSGNNAQKAKAKAKPDVDVKSKAGTFAKPKPKNRTVSLKNMDGNPSANKEYATASENKAARDGLATGWKRFRDYFGEKREVQENRPFKKSKIEGKCELIDPKERSRQWVQTKTRRELEDLVMQKIAEEKETKSKLKYFRSELVKTERTMFIYQNKIADVTQNVQELNTMVSVLNNTPGDPWTGKKVKGQSHAGSIMLPPGGHWASVKKRANLALAKSMKKAYMDFFNIAVSKAKPAKGTSITVNTIGGQSANNAVKVSAQPKERRYTL